MNTQTNNEEKCPKNSIHACEEDHYGNCYFCGRSMLSIPQITTKLPDIKPLNIGKEIGDVEIETTTKDWEKVYCCKNCGIDTGNRADWCNLGCGRDYNEMFEVKKLSYLIESTKQEERKKVLEEVREGKICTNCGKSKEGSLSEWCGECMENE